MSHPGQPPNPSPKEQGLLRALERLKASAPESAQLAELHVYLGLSMEDAALTLDITQEEAHKLWLHARHWLHRELGD